ncbi:MAG: hypothetical protein Q8N99_04130 [Nanoarchaeota archaeon]|nr:hypothetical protein [Nanoarchaeota archaeon]
MVNKKADTIVLETVIFIILNIIFFVTMMIFVFRSGTSSYVYEQTYAKQIALIIDNAKPDMAIMFDISDLDDFLEKNNFPINEVFSIDKQNNKVFVKLGRNSGYSYRYFSDYDIELKANSNRLNIIVRNKS